MKRLLIIALLSTVLIPLGFAFAQDSSPYVVGHWLLNDSFQEIVGQTTTTTTTDNTDFTFVNPTDLTLTLEYAFFAPDGTFCGCDRDTLRPNGRTRYTMQAEKNGGQFSTTLCPTQTEGELKSIVFVSSKNDDRIKVGDALQAGTQVHIFGGTADKRSESNLQWVSINDATVREMNSLHKLCKQFIGG